MPNVSASATIFPEAKRRSTAFSPNTVGITDVRIFTSRFAILVRK